MKSPNKRGLQLNYSSVTDIRDFMNLYKMRCKSILFFSYRYYSIFNKLINKRCDEILKVSKKTNYDDLTDHFKGKNNS